MASAQGIEFPYFRRNTTPKSNLQGGQAKEQFADFRPGREPEVVQKTGVDWLREDRLKIRRTFRGSTFAPGIRLIEFSSSS